MCAACGADLERGRCPRPPALAEGQGCRGALRASCTLPIGWGRSCRVKGAARRYAGGCAAP